MKVFAYRGYSGNYPENTMLAFQKAIEAGADGIQLDIHFSRDKQIIIFHDDSLSRMTNGVGFVRHHSLKDLKNYEIKGTYKGERQRILTLEEYLTWASELPVVTNISIQNQKFYYPGLEKAAIELVKHYAMEDRVIISSKMESTIEDIKNKWSDIQVGWEIANSTEEVLARAVDMKLDVLIPTLASLHDDFIERANAQGMRLLPHAVNTNDELIRLQEHGIDGIMTMFVEASKKALGETDNPYSQEQIEYATALGDEEEEIPTGPRGHIKKQSKKLTGGAFGIIVGIIVSITAAVVATKLIMSFLTPIFGG